MFGLLSASFRILRKPIPLEPKKVELVVLAIVHLHNFLRRNVSSIRSYTPPGTFDREDIETGEIIPGTWRTEVLDSDKLKLKSIPRKSPENAKEIRNEFAKYFVSDQGLSLIHILMFYLCWCSQMLPLITSCTLLQVCRIALHLYPGY